MVLTQADNKNVVTRLAGGFVELLSTLLAALLIALLTLFGLSKESNSYSKGELSSIASNGILCVSLLCSRQ